MFVILPTYIKFQYKTDIFIQERNSTKERTNFLSELGNKKSEGYAALMMSLTRPKTHFFLQTLNFFLMYFITIYIYNYNTHILDSFQIGYPQFNLQKKNDDGSGLNLGQGV